VRVCPSTPPCTKDVHCAVHESACVQVFGRRRRRPSHASGDRRRKSAKARLYNPASFEWSRVVQRGLLSSKSGRGLIGNRGQPSQFAAQGGVFADELMWHRRFDSRPTVDGGTHGPAHGSPSADCARIVREDEVQCPASDRRLCLPSANGAANPDCTGARQGRAATSPGAHGKAAKG
jgi:hypothetical protein